MMAAEPNNGMQRTLTQQACYHQTCRRAADAWRSMASQFL
jgi:hypothetical protein